MGLQGQIPTGVATGVSGSLFAKEVVNSIAAAGTLVPAVGAYYAFTIGAGIVVEVQDSGGVWQAITAAGGNPGHFETDGTNLRFRNGGVGIQTITTIKVG